MFHSKQIIQKKYVLQVKKSNFLRLRKNFILLWNLD